MAHAREGRLLLLMVGGLGSGSGDGEDCSAGTGGGDPADMVAEIKKGDGKEGPKGPIQTLK